MKKKIGVIIIIVMLVVISLIVYDTTNLTKPKSKQELLYDDVKEAIQLTASKYHLGLSNITSNERIIKVTVNNYKNSVIDNKEEYEALFHLMEPFYQDFDDDNYHLEVQFYNVSKQLYEISYAGDFYFIYSSSNVNEYDQKEVNSLYDLKTTYHQLIDLLENYNQKLKAEGYEIAAFEDIDSDNQEDGATYQPSKDNDNYQSDKDDLGRYDSWEDYYFDNKDHLSEQEAIDHWYDEYGDESEDGEAFE